MSTSDTPEVLKPELGRPVEPLFVASGATEKADKYDINHDAFAIGRRSLVVADGCGTENPRVAEAAKAVTNTILAELESAAPADQAEAETVMREVFEHANEVARKARGHTTAAAVLLWIGTNNRKSFITAGNVGDSSAVLFRPDTQPWQDGKARLRRLAPELPRFVKDKFWVEIGHRACNAESVPELRESIFSLFYVRDEDDVVRERTIPEAMARDARLAEKINDATVTASWWANEWFSENRRLPARSKLGVGPVQGDGRGIMQNLPISIETVEIFEGDKTLLFTDGVTDPLTYRGDIRDIVDDNSAKDAASLLLHRARLKNGIRKKDDDRTAIVAEATILHAATAKTAQMLARTTMRRMLEESQDLSAMRSKTIQGMLMGNIPNTDLGELALLLSDALVSERPTNALDSAWFLAGAVALAKALEK